jgi:hypothetical protein
MKKVFNLIFMFSLIGIVFSCAKSDDIETTPLRDYTEQYTKDIAEIEAYLDTHYIESITNNPGQPNDQDIKITAIPTGGPQISILDDQINNGLTFKTVEKDGVTYKIYYLITRQGSGATSKSPCNLDNVLTAYKGQLLNGTVFETNTNPQDYFYLGNVIRGWSEIFPKLKTGSYTANTNGTLSYFNFGAGVMFIPSGLAYYNGATSSIPGYSPLIFTVKLFEVQRVDHDLDGIYSYQEDVNGDGYLVDNDTTHEDDTDQDGTPNFIDKDDDGDNYLTKSELKKPDGTYHTFETVPSCSGQTTKRYLNPNCRPPYTD